MWAGELGEIVPFGGSAPFTGLEALAGFATFEVLVALDALVTLTGFEIGFLFIIYALVVFLVSKIQVSASQFVK